MSFKNIYFIVLNQVYVRTKNWRWATRPYVIRENNYRYRIYKESNMFISYLNNIAYISF